MHLNIVWVNNLFCYETKFFKEFVLFGFFFIYIAYLTFYE